MKWFHLLVSAFMLGNAALTWSAEKTAGIEIGIAPFLPVKTLVQNYAPMLVYLKQRLKEPVTLGTTPDYKSFNERIEKHEYSLVIAAANSAYLAWAEHGYVPLLRPIIYTRPVMVTTKNQKLSNVQDLRGKTVAMSDSLAVVSMQGARILREAGLEPGRDVIIMNMPNHGTAVNYVMTGEVPAAIVSDRAVMQLSPGNNIKIVQIWEHEAAPGIVYLANPNLSRSRREQLTKAILEYAQDVPEGLALMKHFGYGGLKPIGADEMRSLAPYGVLLKEAMSKIP